MSFPTDLNEGESERQSSNPEMAVMTGMSTEEHPLTASSSWQSSSWPPNMGVDQEKQAQWIKEGGGRRRGMQGRKRE